MNSGTKKYKWLYKKLLFIKYIWGIIRKQLMRKKIVSNLKNTLNKSIVKGLKTNNSNIFTIIDIWMSFVLNFLNFKIKYKVSNKSINEITITN